jgi:hypothetical protein
MTLVRLMEYRRQLRSRPARNSGVTCAEETIVLNASEQRWTRIADSSTLTATQAHVGVSNSSVTGPGQQCV